MKRSITILPNMLRNFLSPYYWVTLLALSFASGLFLLEMFQVTTVETKMIVLPKTTESAVAPANAMLLLDADAFGKSVRAIWQEKQESAQFPDWTDEVRVTLLPGSSVIALEIDGDNRSQSEALSRLTVKMLTDALSRWYNMATDIDFRILDGPKAVQRVAHWPLFVLASIGLSIGVTTLFFFILSLVEYWMGRTGTPSKHSSDYHISPETFRPSTMVPPYWSQEYAPRERESLEEPMHEPSTTPEEFQYSNNEPTESFQTEYQPVPMAVESVFQETPDAEDNLVAESENDASAQVQNIATGKAPDNLPIMEDLTPLENAQARLFKADIDTFSAEQSNAAETDLVQSLDNNASESSGEVNIAEPSQEEYKRRLNDLLSGRL